MTRALRGRTGGPPGPAPHPGYEVADVPPWGAAIGLVGVFVLIAVAAGLVLAMFAALAAVNRPSAVSALERAVQVPPAPRLQPVPAAELASVRAAAQARLTGYGWADRQAGVAHIPIERAMELQAQRGWPDQSADTR
jgi:hypothetical protein